MVSKEEWERGKARLADDIKSSELVSDALVFATAAHAAIGQKRKYSGKDYISHPIAAARILVALVPSATFEQVAAELLHDVVEDTQVSLVLIRQLFGVEVARIVNELTEPDEWEGVRPNRAFRHRVECERLKEVSYEGQTGKCADYLANGFDIVEADATFARTYFTEIAEAVRGFDKANPVILGRVQAMIIREMAKLNA
jgi:hypothetical protein